MFLNFFPCVYIQDFSNKPWQVRGGQVSGDCGGGGGGGGGGAQKNSSLG